MADIQQNSGVPSSTEAFQHKPDGAVSNVDSQHAHQHSGGMGGPPSASQPLNTNPFANPSPLLTSSGPGAGMGLPPTSPMGLGVSSGTVSMGMPQMGLATTMGMSQGMSMHGMSTPMPSSMLAHTPGLDHSGQQSFLQPTMHAPPSINVQGTMEEEFSPEKRITIWNKLERRKISGNAAPMGKNLMSYLSKHPECEVFNGQDKQDPIALAFSQPMVGPFSVYSTQESLAHQMQSAQAPNSSGLSMLVAQGGQGADGQPTMAMQGGIQMMGKPPFIQDTTEKRITIWHKTEKRKISGNAAPMEKNLRSYLATHPECEVYTCQDKDSNGAAASGLAGTIPVTIPENENETTSPFEESNLTPVDTPLGEFDSHLTEKSPKGVPINTPSLRAAMQSQRDHMAVSPMSPVDSLASSFNTMDFSLGSNSHSMMSDRIRHMRDRAYSNSSQHFGTPGTAMSMDMDPPDRRGYRDTTGADDERRERSSTDDFGVMGRPDGF